MSDSEKKQDWKEAGRGCLMLIGLVLVLGMMAECNEACSGTEKTSKQKQSDSKVAENESSDSSEKSKSEEVSMQQFRIQGIIFPWVSPYSTPYPEGEVSWELAGATGKEQITSDETSYLFKQDIKLPALSEEPRVGIQIKNTSGFDNVVEQLEYRLATSTDQNWFVGKRMAGFIAPSSHSPMSADKLRSNSYVRLIESEEYKKLREYIEDSEISRLQKHGMPTEVYSKLLEVALKTNDWELAFKSLLGLYSEGDKPEGKIQDLYTSAVQYLTKDYGPKEPEKCLEEINRFRAEQSDFIVKVSNLNSSKKESSDSTKPPEISSSKQEQLRKHEQECRMKPWKENGLIKRSGQWLKTSNIKHKVHRAKKLKRIVNPRQKYPHEKKVYKAGKGAYIAMIPMSIYNDSNEILDVSGGAEGFKYYLVNSYTGRVIKRFAHEFGEAYFWKHYPNQYSGTGTFGERFRVKTGQTQKTRLFYQVPERTDPQHWYLKIPFTEKDEDGQRIEKRFFVPIF